MSMNAADNLLFQLADGLGFLRPPLDGMKLHIGGKLRVPGWTNFDIIPAPHVDIVGNCTDLGQIESGTCTAVYSSHVLEHLTYDEALPRALSECHRVLKPGGLFLVSVPDLDRLCKLFIDPSSTTDERYCIMQVLYGGHTDPYDIHLGGFSQDIMAQYLRKAGFAAEYRVGNFGLFPDASALIYKGVPISLNMVAVRT